MNKKTKSDIMCKNNWEIIPGTIPVIFSAPHAAPQTREGQRKPCDEFTGEIVKKLCQETGAYGIIRIENFDDDPNYYNEGLSLEFKNEIVDLIGKHGIKYGFDIHGCLDDLGFSIDIGTNYGENLKGNIDFLSNVQKSLANNVGGVTVDEMFDAGKNEIVSTYVSNQTKCPYIQLELCRLLREDTSYLVSLITKVVKDIVKELA